MKIIITAALVLLASLVTLTGCDTTSGCRALEVERQALQIDGSPIVPVGVAVDPASGARFVLDGSSRLYTLSPEGTLQLRRDLSESLMVADQPLGDLCAISATELYTVAPWAGLRVDLDTNEVKQHFCIVPGFEEDPGMWDNERQETHAIACDPVLARIYAQPQTLPLDLDDNQPIRSEVSYYDLPTGADMGWFQLPSESYLAGGMAVVGEGVVLLGRGSLLSRFDLETGEHLPVTNLESVGIGSIEGMAIDRALGHLLVVDGEDSELVVLDLESLYISP